MPSHSRSKVTSSGVLPKTPPSSETVAPSGLEVTGTMSGPPATIEAQAGNMRTANAAKETEIRMALSISLCRSRSRGDRLGFLEARGG